MTNHLKYSIIKLKVYKIYNGITMGIELEGIFLSLDYTDLITESFAKRYCVDVNKWIVPFAYYDQVEQIVINNGSMPDGLYALLGWVDYPGKSRMSHHTVFQFNICKSLGMNLSIYKKFNSYPNLPVEIPLKPKFPMFKIGSHTEYNEAKKIYDKLSESYLTSFFLQDRIQKINDSNNLESRIYRIRLALQKQIERKV